MAWSIAIALLAVAIALVWLYLRYIYTYWARHGVPYEEPNYLFGNLRGLGKTTHLRDIVQRLYMRYKHNAPIAGLYMFSVRIVVPLDLELIKHILIKDFANFHDRGVFHNSVDDPLTAHLFALEGVEWRAMRTKLSPVFTSGKMKFMFPTVVAVGRALTQTCAALVAQDEVLELGELCARYTTDVIGTCAFGIACNSLHDPDAEFRLRGRDIFNTQRHSQLVTNFMITNPQWARKLHMKFYTDEVSNFFIGAVRRTVAYRLEHGVQRNDFMNLLIELMAKDQQAAASVDKHGIDLSEGLSLLQMAAEAFMFFVAGFDTSSTTMSFCLYELALNETLQEKTRAEIRRVLAEHSNEVSYEAMGSMHYLDQVVAETLRKYPIVSVLLRQTRSSYHIPNTAFTIERGMRIFVPVYALHHDPAIYPEPQKFDPERFAPEAVMARHPCAYLPFGDGPRNCIGLRFGKMQTKVGLIQLLKDFKFSRCARTEVPVEFCKSKLLLAAKNGLYLRVEPLTQ